MFDTHVDRLLQRWLEADALVDERGQVRAAELSGLSRSTLIANRRVLTDEGVPGLRQRAENSARRSPDYVAALRREASGILQDHPSWGRKRLARALRQRGYAAASTTLHRVLQDVRDRNPHRGSS